MAMAYVVVLVLLRLTQAIDRGDMCVVRGLANATCAVPFKDGYSAGTDEVSVNTFADYASAFSTFSFALTTHTALPPILQEMRSPTNKRSSIVILAMCWLPFTLYMLVGMGGYLQFGSRQCPVITNAYVDDRAMQIAQIFVIVCVTGGHPIQTFQARISLDALLSLHTWLFTK